MNVFGSVKVKKIADDPLSGWVSPGIFVANSLYGTAGRCWSCVVAGHVPVFAIHHCLPCAIVCHVPSLVRWIRGALSGTTSPALA